MRHLRSFALACLVAGALVAAACGGSNPTQPTPAEPTVTDPFSGSIDSGGSQTFVFNVGVAGKVNATVVTVTTLVNGVATPSSVPLGFDLGAYNGVTCVPYYENTAATAGTILSATTSLTGAYCVRIFDVGQIVPGVPVSYAGTVAHP